MSLILSGPNDDSNILHESMGKKLFEKFKQHGDRVAFIDGVSNESWTFKEILIKSIKLSIALKRFGLKEDDVVAVVSENNLHYFVPYLACLYCGFIVHNLNPEYTKYELSHALLMSKPKFIFTCNKALPVVLKTKEENNLTTVVVLLSSDQNSPTLDIESLLTLGDNKTDSFEPEMFNTKEKAASISMSSGTTGLPKGVMLSHQNLRQILVYNGPNFVNFKASDVTLCNLPCFHIFGSMVVLPALYYGAKLVFMAKFVPKVYLHLLEKYKVTKLFVVPALALFFLKNSLVQEYDLKSIQHIYSGGAPLSVDVELQLKDKMKADTHNMYGLTETTGIVTFNKSQKNIKGSIGTLVPNIKAKVVDLLNGGLLGPNETGELCFKGSLMLRYLNNDEATRTAIDGDGFLHTGDVGYYDEDGYFYVVDRIKDLLKYKGFQVSPVEIEAVLITHPAVNDAAVVGLPDEKCGELALAFIVKQPYAEVSQEDLKDYVAEHLSPQKRLYGGVRFIDEIPKNPSGKILRKSLRNNIKFREARV